MVRESISEIVGKRPENGGGQSGALGEVNPFFIVGYPRSGTTLTSVLLDRHSRIAVSPETNFFTGLCPIDRATRQAEPLELVRRFGDGFRTRDLNLDNAELYGELMQGEPTGANLLSCALTLYRRKQGKEIVGEKTPDHWRFVPQILELYPRSRVIWVVRDGRDTVLSVTKAPWRPNWDLEYHACHWRISMESMLEYEATANGRIMRMCFEKLVTSPREELARLCGFLGMEFQERQLDTSVASDVVPAWERDWKFRAFLKPDPSRIGMAARELPKEQLDLLSGMMRPVLRRLGYRAD